MYNNFLSKKSKKAISALLASALVITAAPISADAATNKIVGVGKSTTVSVSAKAKVSGLSKAEKKVVKVTKKGKKFTIKGLKAGKASFKIGKKAFNVKVGATSIKKKSFATSLTVGSNKNVTVNAVNGKADTLTWKSSNTKIVKVSKASSKASSKKVASNTLKPVKAGKANITVTSKNTGRKLTVKVTVKAKVTPTKAPVATSQAPAATTNAPQPTQTASGPAATTEAPQPTQTASGPAATTEAPQPTQTASGPAATTEAPQPTQTASGPAATTEAPNVTTAPAVTETPAPGVELAVITASAVSTNKISVVFNQTVTAGAVTKDDVVVTETSSKERVFAKEVTTDADKKAVVIEFYDNLASDKTYEIIVNVAGKAYTLNLAYSVGAPARIDAKAQTIPFGEARKVAYTVYDANGVDVTATTAVRFTSDKNITEDGKLTLTPEAKTAFVNITYTLQNGTTIQSGQFIVTGEAKKATSLTNYTVSATQSPDYSAADYKQNTIVYMNSSTVYLNAQFKDQFGSVVDSDDVAVINYTSLDTSVAVVDKTSGQITPLKAGTVPVKIEAVKGSDVQYSQTVQITVVPASTVQSVKAEKSAVTLYRGLTKTSDTVNVYTEDQYQTKGTAGLNCNIISGDSLVGATVVDGVLTVTLKPVEGNNSNKTGTAVIKVSYGTGANELSTNVVVTVKELGTISKYNVEGAKNVLDFNTSATATDANYNADRMEISVNPVDVNGDVAGDPSEFTYQVTTGSGIGIISGAAVGGVASRKAVLKLNETYDVVNKEGNKIGETQLVKDETYNVAVKVGNLIVNNFTFTVKDGRVAPAVTIAKGKATISVTSGAALTGGTNILADMLKKADVIRVASDVEVRDIDFVSANTNIITAQGAFVQADASYNTPVTLVIKNVTVKKGDNTFTVDVNQTIELTVSRSDAEKAAAEKAAAKATAETKLAAIAEIVNEIADTASVTAAKEAIAAYKAAGATDAEVEALNSYAKLTAATAKIAKNVAKKTANDAITALKVKISTAASVDKDTNLTISEVGAAVTAVEAYIALKGEVTDLTDNDIYTAVVDQKKANDVATALTVGDIVETGNEGSSVVMKSSYNKNGIIANLAYEADGTYATGTGPITGSREGKGTVTVTVTVGNQTNNTKVFDATVDGSNNVTIAEQA